MAQERFQHSGETISRWFEIVLDDVGRMAVDYLKPSDPYFKGIPRKIKDDNRYWPYFKDCIGTIDGTHVPVVMLVSKQIPYIGRKGSPTQSIMDACDFNMCFTFAWARWEGKYYLVDTGYPQMKGYLGLYKDQEFKPYDDDKDKLPSDDEEENATQDVYEERHPNCEMDKECDSIVTLLMLR
ncbi:hypothetical protein Dsin_008442 [Dipteronia sinensis]|uniref:DDE Tnp4 domain-containing protein n=1 Tax=Dipteronia sinensis TaxID=43782 RepID=A0AAE0AP06_9ROSI|nr:hypothetical protein Dsin_008442 [Dipteronia sinensis]